MADSGTCRAGVQSRPLDLKVSLTRPVRDSRELLAITGDDPWGGLLTTMFVARASPPPRPPRRRVP